MCCFRLLCNSAHPRPITQQGIPRELQVANPQLLGAYKSLESLPRPMCDRHTEHPSGSGLVLNTVLASLISSPISVLSDSPHPLSPVFFSSFPISFPLCFYPLPFHPLSFHFSTLSLFLLFFISRGQRRPSWTIIMNPSSTTTSHSMLSARVTGARPPPWLDVRRSSIVARAALIFSR